MSGLRSTGMSLRGMSETPEEPLLTQVSQTIRGERSASTSAVSGSSPSGSRSNQTHGAPSTTRPGNWQDMLQILRSQPDTDTVVSILKSLTPRSEAASPVLDVSSLPSPPQAQVVRVLINSVAPTFWTAFNNNEKTLLATCLKSASGAAAVIEQIKKLTALVNKLKCSTSDIEQLRVMLHLANAILYGNDTLLRVWRKLCAPDAEELRRELLWKEYVNLIASGNVIAKVAQAEDALKMQIKALKPIWLSSGDEFAAWLGKNVAQFVVRCGDSTDEHPHFAKAAYPLLLKSFNLGYPMPLIGNLWTTVIHVLLHKPATKEESASLLDGAPSFVQKKFLELTLRWLTTFTSPESISGAQPSRAVLGMTAVIDLIVKNKEFLKSELIVVLVDTTLLGSFSLDLIRAAVAVISKSKANLTSALLGRAMNIFSDNLFINHATALQQESLAQTLLITAAYVHRMDADTLVKIARSSNHMQGVSNRLSSSNERARWLGMVVGTAISSLVDQDGPRLKFSTPDMNTERTNWFLELVKTEDDCGSLEDALRLFDMRKSQPKTQHNGLPILNGKPVYGPAVPPSLAQTKIVAEKEPVKEPDLARPSERSRNKIVNGEIIEAVETLSSDEDDDIGGYAKPDSDPDDSDEDATLVNRSKFRIPVYIRDIMRMLREDKDHDCFEIGLKSAWSLIRKKTNFGTEVTDHAEEIASILCNLQDPFDTENFEDLKLKALIAILMSDVPKFAPWLSKKVFDGHFSLSQRCTILSALGFGGREFALGVQDWDFLSGSAPSGDNDFPSKRLPRHLDAIYRPKDPSVQYIDAATKDVQRELVKPIALAAADKSTAEFNAVKVRDFASHSPNAGRTKRKATPNELAKVLGNSFFFPLMSGYQQEISAYGIGSVFTTAPFVRVTFLKTLALLLHASGPATVDLPNISTAFWDLLLSLRVPAIADVSLLEATLFSLLTVMEVNGEASPQRIVQENPKHLMETKQWVELVFERTGAGNFITEGTSGDESRIRALAAGVLIKTTEFIEAYQAQLLGKPPA